MICRSDRFIRQYRKEKDMTLLAGIDDIYHFTEAPLYEHMTFREIRPEFAVQLREDLLKSFQDEESYGFLQGDSRWEELT